MSKHFYFEQFNLAEVRTLVLFNRYIGPYQVLLLVARVDQEAMAMKGYYEFPKAPVSDCLVPFLGHSLGVGLTPLQRCSRCFLQPQPTGQSSCGATSMNFPDLFRYPSPSFIAPGRSFRLIPVSAQSCCKYVRGGRPKFAGPCERVQMSTSLLSSPLLLQVSRMSCLSNLDGFRDG